MSGGFLRLLREPLNKDDCRAIGVAGVLGISIGTVLGFAVAPRWELAATGALAALPGSLFGGVLSIALERAKRRMPSQMTSTAYRQGVKNALACGVGLLVTWLLIGGIIWQTTGTSDRESFGIAFAAIWFFVFVWFLAAWLYGRQARGRLLLDCGPHPSRKVFLLSAVVFLILGMITGMAVGSSAIVSGIAVPVLLALGGVYWLCMAAGRLQVRENGIWQYWGLLRWGRIESYHWADDGTWLVKARGFSLSRRGALQVPPEYRGAFDELLQKYGAVEDRKDG